MDITGESRKRQEFRNILISLANHQFNPKNKKEKAAIYQKLEALYHSSETAKLYRHFYTDILNVFIKLEEDKSGSAEVVCLNLESIRRGYQVKSYDANGEPIDISESLKKLYDHASLEMARMNYAKRNEEFATSHEEALQLLKSDLSNCKSDLQTMERSMKDAQKDYIAILSIFAAVVIVFFSGVGFSSSVLANIHQAEIARVITGIVLLGMVLFDVIWFLFELLKDLIDKPKNSRNPFYFVNVTALIILFLIWCFFANS